ncbi:XkdX family protein [Paenibacillus profundus]|uniref:XkdX family protein n=1 Tax=Paenibacillus profundus TaxID=1173085 RepID=A0ABS8YGC7_9BACL|nr:XkdX family protein [Paenibacillus profundus]MCE5169416.1 XkdX family protein [Paenibacillus profundus]
MNWFATIKRYYDMGIYKIEPEEPLYVGKFCESGKITPEQYHVITGDKYKAK